MARYVQVVVVCGICEHLEIKKSGARFCRKHRFYTCPGCEACEDFKLAVWLNPEEVDSDA